MVLGDRVVERQGREPVFNAPWPALLIAASIPVVYFFQSQVGDTDSLYRTFGLIPYSVEHGDYVGLFSSMVLHGNWAHALMNAAFALAFGVPVARLMGEKWNNAIAFFLFYIVCGVAANLIYVWLNPGSFTPLIGASGAVSGLMGAAARLIYTRGVLGPVFSRTVFFFGAALVVINLIVGVVGAPGAEGMPIAWQAHLAGLFVGLLLIGPWAALFGRRSIAEASIEAPLPARAGPWGPAQEPEVQVPPIDEAPVEPSDRI
jgi:membrane associated rhomboid family serine protease